MKTTLASVEVLKILSPKYKCKYCDDGDYRHDDKQHCKKCGHPYAEMLNRESSDQSTTR